MLSVQLKPQEHLLAPVLEKQWTGFRASVIVKGFNHLCTLPFTEVVLFKAVPLTVGGPPWQVGLCASSLGSRKGNEMTELPVALTLEACSQEAFKPCRV